jgi:hypothetical protein
LKEPKRFGVFVHENTLNSKLEKFKLLIESYKDKEDVTKDITISEDE